MSSHNDYGERFDALTRVDAGDQVLLTVRSDQRPLRLLPPAAYENLLVLSSDSPGEVAQTLADLGVDVGRVGHVPISSTEFDHDGPLWTADAVAPDDLTGLSIAYTEALNALGPGRGWILVDSLDVLLLFNEEPRLVSFLDHVTQRAREKDLRGVYALVPEAVDDATRSTLRRSVDRDCDAR